MVTNGTDNCSTFRGSGRVVGPSSRWSLSLSLSLSLFISFSPYTHTHTLMVDCVCVQREGRSICRICGRDSLWIVFLKSLFAKNSIVSTTRHLSIGNPLRPLVSNPISDAERNHPFDVEGTHNSFRSLDIVINLTEKRSLNPFFPQFCLSKLKNCTKLFLIDFLLSFIR
jgi:hypothetical protein